MAAQADIALTRMRTKLLCKGSIAVLCRRANNFAMESQRGQAALSEATELYAGPNLGGLGARAPTIYHKLLVHLCSVGQNNNIV